MSDPYAWWRTALEGVRQPVYEMEPEPGWYKRRFTRNGPWVPCVIWWAGEKDAEGNLIGDEKVYAMMGDEMVDPITAWNHVAGHPITYQEYLSHMGAEKTEASDEAEEPKETASLSEAELLF